MQQVKATKNNRHEDDDDGDGDDGDNGEGKKRKVSGKFERGARREFLLLTDLRCTSNQSGRSSMFNVQ